MNVEMYKGLGWAGRIFVGFMGDVTWRGRISRAALFGFRRDVFWWNGLNEQMDCWPPLLIAGVERHGLNALHGLPTSSL